jgi:hypothetical protein
MVVRGVLSVRSRTGGKNRKHTDRQLSTTLAVLPLNRRAYPVLDRFFNSFRHSSNSVTPLPSRGAEATPFGGWWIQSISGAESPPCSKWLHCEITATVKSDRSRLFQNPRSRLPAHSSTYGLSFICSDEPGTLYARPLATRVSNQWDG